MGIFSQNRFRAKFFDFAQICFEGRRRKFKTRAQNAAKNDFFSPIVPAEQPFRQRQFHSVQSRCIVNGEAQKSPFFGDFQGVVAFLRSAFSPKPSTIVGTCFCYCYCDSRGVRIPQIFTVDLVVKYGADWQFSGWFSPQSWQTLHNQVLLNVLKFW